MTPGPKIITVSFLVKVRRTDNGEDKKMLSGMAGLVIILLLP